MADIAVTERFRHQIALTALSVFACTLSTSVLAANAVVCDKAQQDISGLTVSIDELSVSVIDHVSSDSDDIAADSLDTTEIDTSSIPPLLTLSPRAVSILDQVFEADDGVEVVSPDESLAEPASISRRFSGHPGIPARQSSPVAEQIDDEQLELPAIREQMFRKDI
jgi:hypothetical protein